MKPHVTIGIVLAGLAGWGLLFVAAGVVPPEAVPLVLGIFTFATAVVAIFAWGLSPKGDGNGRRDET
jgi:hypothetical protein